MKYQKHKHSELSDSIRFLDKHGQEIPACIEYNTDTGYATVYELADPTNPHSPVIQRQKPYPDAKCIVDNIVNPSEQDMEKIREKKTEMAGG